jgi:hypothetical protein
MELVSVDKDIINMIVSHVKFVHQVVWNVIVKYNVNFVKQVKILLCKTMFVFVKQVLIFKMVSANHANQSLVV